MKKPWDKKVLIIMIGIIVLFVIVVNWSAELSYVQERLESGANVERGAEIRTAINSRYGIWFVLVLFATSVITYICGLKPREHS